MVARTWTIFSENIPAVSKLLDRMNRKAARLGMGGLSLSLGNVSTQKIEGAIYQMRDVTVTGMTPLMRGWQFVATISHAGEAGNILRTIPTWQGDLPSEFRDSDPGRCDHCKMYRRRSDTFVVTDGTVFRQVGRQCLADFLGTDKVEQVMMLAEMWASIEDTCGGFQDIIPGKTSVGFNMQELMAFAAQSVITYGWVSRGKAQELGKQATADVAIYNLTRAYKLGRDFPDTAAVTLAEKVLTWVPSWIERETARNEVSDYVWNMRVVFASEFVPGKSVGLAVSAIGAYQRDMEREEKRNRERQNATSVHVGTVGKRQSFNGLVVKAFRTLDTRFGVSTLITYADGSGNIIKWFASGYQDVQVGDTVNLTATVKEHGEWNGVPETTITRAKVVQA